MPLQPETERELIARRDAFLEADQAARVEAGLRYTELLDGPRRAYLESIVHAVDVKGESQVDVAKALGVSKQRVSQLLQDARGVLRRPDRDGE